MDNTSWIDPVSMEAHSLQWQSPRESTKAFSEFLHGILGVGSHNVIDLGCGTGAATYYLAKKFPSSVFVGLDLSPELIRVANEIDLVKSQSNLSFQVGDMFDLAVIPNIDCVISQQTLSWLPEYEEPFRQIFTKIGPKFLMISSLLYEGDITAKTIISENVKKRKVFYNTYSIPEIERFSKGYGYEVLKFQPFEIPIELQKPTNLDIMGTYTVNVLKHESTERLQISGPLLMSQMFLCLIRVGESPNAN
jgi:ubiquinone/menaquinone biosynthesis C-methylase UbiE